MGGPSTTLTLRFNGADVQKGLKKVLNGFNDLSKKLGKMLTGGMAIGTAALVGGFLALAVASSKAAAENESLATSFAVLTGNADKAKKILAEIKEFGATTPLEQKDIQKAAQTLLAFGVNLNDVMPTLRMLGDVSMGNAERLGSLALVFGQVSSAGKLTGGDLLQFINVGFNPLNEISKRTGKSMIELRKEMENGGITSGMVAQAFRDATGAGGMFNGMLLKMANTTEGKLSNLHDAIHSLEVAFGTGINSGLRVGLDAANSFLPQLEERIRKTGAYIGTAFADGVSGNYEKFAQIGELIGEAVGVGFKTGFEAIATKTVEGFTNALKAGGGLDQVIFPGTSKGLGAADTSASFASTSDLLAANLQNSGIGARLKAMSEAPTGRPSGPFPDGRSYRFAGPNEESNTIDGATGKRIIAELQGINRKLQPVP